MLALFFAAERRCPRLAVVAATIGDRLMADGRPVRSMANAFVGWILTPGRFSLAFYAGRSFVVITATVVLVVLLTETMTLYARLAVSIFAQRRERESRMMTMEAWRRLLPMS
jgi:hypothetical protein